MAMAYGNLVATTSLGRTLRGVHEALIHAVHVRACAAFQLTDRVAHFRAVADQGGTVRGVPQTVGLTPLLHAWQALVERGRQTHLLPNDKW